MALLDFLDRSRPAEETTSSKLSDALGGFSIEVMPRTAGKIESFADLLPRGTRVYIAHIEGTALDDMVATARRLADEGMAVMPHFPARGIKDEADSRNGSCATATRPVSIRRCCSPVASPSRAGR